MCSTDKMKGLDVLQVMEKFHKCTLMHSSARNFYLSKYLFQIFLGHKQSVLLNTLFIHLVMLLSFIVVEGSFYVLYCR